MNPAPHGVIRADEVYTVPEFRRRARLGQYAWRKLRASGFPVIEIGRKLYVLGEDFIQYCREQRDGGQKRD